MHRITVNPREKKIDVSRNLYGLFFEDINRAGDGGLYAELLRKRAFDEGVLPEGCVYDEANKLITPEMLIPVVQAECEIEYSDLDIELLNT